MLRRRVGKLNHKLSSGCLPKLNLAVDTPVPSLNRHKIQALTPITLQQNHTSHRPYDKGFSIGLKTPVYTTQNDAALTQATPEIQLAILGFLDSVVTR